MNTVLYLYQATGSGWVTQSGKFWLHADKAPQANRYFVEGEDTLVDGGPTWFDTEEAARAAAEAMGFVVLPSTYQFQR